MITALRRATKWNSYPRLLVPITRGPLVGFFHFLTGYWVPTYWYQTRNPLHRTVLLHGGAMNDWFRLLPDGECQTIEATEGLQTAYRARRTTFARGYRTVVFEDWDRYQLFSSRPLGAVAEHIRERFHQNAVSGERTLPKKVVLLGRGHVPGSLQKHPHRKFAAEKRTIPNLDEIAQALEEHYHVTFLDGAATAPETMVKECLSADLLLGQHGAGLSNCLFLKPGSTVAEIRWKAVADNDLGHFREMSKSLGHKWKPLPFQEVKNSPVDPEMVVSRVTELVSPV